VARAARWLAATRPGSALLRQLVPLDRRVLERSGGRYTALGPFGTPLLLLTTTGARSGEARTTPLFYIHEGERLLVAGSNFGQAAHPAWSSNLLAHPEAEVTMGGERIAVRARLFAGDDAAAGWQRFREAARPYRAYAERTDRQIRVFALERQGEG